MEKIIISMSLDEFNERIKKEREDSGTNVSRKLIHDLYNELKGFKQRWKIPDSIKKETCSILEVLRKNIEVK